MITAIARFERTHTVSRLQAKVALLEYLATRQDQAKESFYENMAITQAYNKVFSNLLNMRSSTSKEEFIQILESTFKEADHKTAEIIVNRIKVLYWHPIVKELVSYADRANHSGETIVALAALAMATDRGHDHAQCQGPQRHRRDCGLLAFAGPCGHGACAAGHHRCDDAPDALATPIGSAAGRSAG